MINIEKWNRLRAEHTAKEKVRINLFYYDNSSGNGDLLYNTCREIIDRNVIDAWSDFAIDEVFVTLNQGLRWPDYMSHLIKVTDQTRMTQDSWLLAYCCAVHLDRINLIKKYKPSVKIFNLPDKWAWRRALLGKWNLYWLWRRITPHWLLQDFVYVFYGYMDQAYLTQSEFN